MIILYITLKPYNLTYFIRFIAVATFRDPFFVTSHRKPYKMCYIEDFIMKSIKKNINAKEFDKLMIYTRGREGLRLHDHLIFRTETCLIHLFGHILF